MSILEYLMSLVIWMLVMSIVLFMWGFHQQMGMKFQNKLDAIRNSIALYQTFKQWAQVPEQTDVFQMKNTQLLVRKKVGNIEIIHQLRNQKSFKVSQCHTGVEEMSVWIWDKNLGVEARVLTCHDGQLNLEKRLPKFLEPPLYVMWFYPIQLSVEGSRLYLNYHQNKQVWLSGFEYLKFSLDEHLNLEVKWPNLPSMRWRF